MAKKTLAVLMLTMALAAAPAAARQLIVVRSAATNPANHQAILRAYSGTKLMLGPWPVEVGYNGLSGDRREGDGTTPTGTFSLGSTIYGVARRPRGLHYRYHRLVCGDWWDEDPYSRLYNRFVHVRCGVVPSFAPGSEALWKQTKAYSYLVVVRFNMGPIVGGSAAPGSGIFIHSWVGGATAGCVALRPAELLALLRWLRPVDRPQIRISVG